MINLYLESTSLLEKVKGKSIMSSLTKKTPLSKEKLLSTEKVTISEEVEKDT